ncbi:MAG: peptidase C39 [Lachnospiraceae bacterium]|nr:peptidase C39 [Lachnospiraceae bacterium]
MKNPLHYQLSEYDCGPTAVLDAISYLFEREEIPPEVIRNVMLYCLDCYSVEGVPGKSGTSTAAMMFLCNWLNGFGRTGRLDISGRYLSGQSVYIGQESYINDALKRGGAAVVRLFYDEAHYVVLTGIREDKILMFDPYYRAEPFDQKDIQVLLDQPFRYNRIVPESYFNKETYEIYALGPYDMREAVLLFNCRTMVTPEKSIEYFI